MQQFITPDKFQYPTKHKSRYGKEAGSFKPSPLVVRNLLAYAAALRILKTKNMGVIHILMN